MASTFARVMGGALKGLGAGMMAQAEEKRAEAMRRLEMEYADGNIQGTTTDAEGNQFGYTRRGGLIPFGIKEPGAAPKPPTLHTFTEGDQSVEKEWVDGEWVERGRGPRWQPNAGGGSSESLVEYYDETTKRMVHGTRAEARGKPSSRPDNDGGISSADDKLLDRLEAANSVIEEDEYGKSVKRVDPAKMAAALRRNGRADLAKIYEDEPEPAPSAPRGPIQSRNPRFAPGGNTAPAGARTSRPNPANDKAADAIALPPELAGEPDGTIVADDSGRRYEKRGNQLIPAR